MAPQDLSKLVDSLDETVYYAGREFLSKLDDETLAALVEYLPDEYGFSLYLIQEEIDHRKASS